MIRKLPNTLTLAIMAAMLAGCPKKQPAGVTPAADSAAIRARADSLAAVHRRDSLAALARNDSLTRARADSVARDAASHRADSVRAQVLRDSTDAASNTPSGLDHVADSIIAAPIHFELDKSDLTPEVQGQLEYKLNVLRAHGHLELQIEGHCDERGPDEYNLALGERRAAAVKRYLVEHGIADARLTIVSYGEERPVDPRHVEEAWAKNRRAEFKVTRSAR